MKLTYAITAGVLALMIFNGSNAHATETQKISRLDRTNLLQYRDSTGVVQQGTTIDHWEQRRNEALRGMQEVTGPLPGPEKRTSLDVKVEEETDCREYIRRLITYAPEPDSRVPAYLLIPKKAFQLGAKVPGVLALQSTHRELGPKVAVGLGGADNRDYGHELAKRGCVVLAPAYPQMADYQPDLKGLGYASGTMKAIWDNIRGLDLLDSLPYVKAGHYGGIGHSLGGHNAIYTAVFDPRIKVIVSSCGFDSFPDYMDGNIAGWAQQLYMPRIGTYKLEDIPFDFHELIAALAPRVVFVTAPTRDANFQWQSVDKIAKAARPIFDLYGAADNLIIKHPECEHDFPDEVREPALETILKHLN